MRNLLLIAIVLSLTTTVSAQIGQSFNNYKVHKNPAKEKTFSGDESAKQSTSSPYNPHPMLKAPGDTDRLGTTTYDLQTNNSVCRRVVDYGNNELGASWIYSMDFSLASSDRGTGYNYFDGNSWKFNNPQSRIEQTRVGWANIGYTGDREFVVTHANNVPGMNFAYRNQIGSGTWQNKTIPNDENATWPRADNMGDSIFVIVSRAANSAGALPPKFNGLEGGLALHRSWDGGDNWIGPDTIEGLNSNNIPQGTTTQNGAIPSIGGDEYAIDANGDAGVVAFVTGFPRPLLFKSTDYGDTWDMTPLIDVSNPLYQLVGEEIDSTVTSDESYSLIVDDKGKAHVFYGRQVILDDDSTQDGYTFYPFDAGIMYWNEYMGENEDPKLIWETRPAAEQEELCFWTLTQNQVNQDWSNAYFQSAVSMPQASMDQNGNIYLTYSAIRSAIIQNNQVINFDQYDLPYRNQYLVKSTNNGKDWQGPVNLNQDSVQEALYGSMPRDIKGDSVHVLYQADKNPGTAVQSDNSPGSGTFVINDIVMTNVHKNNIDHPKDITCPTITEQSDTGYLYASCAGNTLVDDSLRATDVPEGIVTDEVQIIGSLSSTSPGHVQTLQYYVTDNAGNSSDTLERVVKVVPDSDDNVAPQVSLIGFDTIDVVVNNSYTDVGANASDNSGCLDTVQENDNVNTSATGIYTYTYIAFDNGGNTDTAQRIVNVIPQDTIKPSIVLNGSNPTVISACDGQYTEPGATATDNTGNLTDSITISGTVDNSVPGNYEIIYTATDGSGNTDTTIRNVLVQDTEAPNLQLQGPDTVRLCLGNSYSEQGANANDCVEGNVSNQVNIDNSSVNGNSRGTYTVDYSVSDSSGNQAVDKRTVVVNTEPEAGFRINNKNQLTVVFEDTSLYNPSSWTWTFGDNTSKQDQNVVKTFNSNGTYKVCLEVTNAFNNVCGTQPDSTCMMVTVQGVGISETSLDKNIRLYPNPSSGQVNIKFGEVASQEATIRVHDVIGKTHRVMEDVRIAKNDEKSLSLKDLDTGLYFITIKTDEGTVTKKATLTSDN